MHLEQQELPASFFKKKYTKKIIFLKYTKKLSNFEIFGFGILL